MQLDNWRKRQTDISNELVNLYKDDIYDSTDEKAVSPEHFRLLATLPAIRDELKSMNVVIKDTREGTTFEII